ncbi:Imm7 family immunity protein [Amycolatopsis saalfeldensis]|uniref:Immunity protein 7 n=1 Tax=Amycolatopsis saalfeldensis TaxID=394193 RepID=A0A1H8YNJ1_9PSEU|nr:Imm7 family immunity protein [Amycolatopsis saalfeldensis]SEP53765.1 Immunity protein 7 [Amycolatopsis saalfeldensis]
MYEFHGWFQLSESPKEIEFGEEKFDDLLKGVRDRVAEIDWASGEAALKVFNGEHLLLVNGAPNRRRDEERELTELLEYVARQLPGSWGLLYEQAEDMESPPGQGGYRVRVMARGEITVRLDPFLSPVQPVVED